MKQNIKVVEIAEMEKRYIVVNADTGEILADGPTGYGFSSPKQAINAYNYLQWIHK